MTAQDTIKATYTAGLLVRGELRAFLREAAFYHGARWSEHKGFLESRFFVEASRSVHGEIQAMSQGL